MIKVAILDDYQNVANRFIDWKLLKNKIDVKIFNEYIGKDNNLNEKLKEFDVLCLMRERTPLSKELIEQLPNLKLVVTSGMWNASIDNAALKKRNITLCGTDTQVSPTAELTWTLIMIGWRGILTELENMSSGRWQTTIGRSLKGKTLGVFGLGKQGLQVANFGKAFGMKVIAWSHNLKKDDCNRVGIEYVECLDLFKKSDVLTIHTRLSDRTFGFVDMSKLKLMKKDAFLVNTSRGPIIKEIDLITCLQNKKIGGAALDVFDIEPLPKDSNLRAIDNLILTPHIGYVSFESYSKFFKGYFLAIEAFIDGNFINVID
jgi:phosphoglycerate dehydrogenase-like enzyme